VLVCGVVFVLLTGKYAEVCQRYPEGGGIVAAASDAFGDVAGLAGGMLITVDYFLTSALSVVIAVHQLRAVMDINPTSVALIAAAGLGLLGALNLVGVKEAARVVAVVALFALAAQVALEVTAGIRIGADEWHAVRGQMVGLRAVAPQTVVVGFAAAWLAFSGVESIAQLAPILAEPRGRTSRAALWLVAIGALATSPLLTTFATVLPEVPKTHPERFLTEMGMAFGGAPLGWFVLLTAVLLLALAANTAMVGCYHVFVALTRAGFLPASLAERHRRFGTPHWAVLIATLAPMAIAVATHGNVTLLGELYAFGLLGAFTLVSAAIDWLRWQDRQRGLRLWIGVVVTLALGAAWAINLVSKWGATLYGGLLTIGGIALGLAVRKGRAFAPREALTSAEAAERAAERERDIRECMILEQAMDLAPLERASTLVAVRGPNPRLYKEAARHVRGIGERNIYVLYVDEVPGLFFPPKIGPSPDALAVLEDAGRAFRDLEIDAIPIWRMAHSAGESIATAARKLGVKAVMVGTSQRTAIWHLLRGNVLQELTKQLPEATRVLIVN
jgi:amino acid transporter